MAERPFPFELQEALRFRPRIWWDPVPALPISIATSCSISHA